MTRKEPTTRGNRRRVLVLQDLKTEKSRRTLVMPKVCLAALKAHRVRQLEERLKAGAHWKSEQDLVFAARRGGPLDPRNVLRQTAARAATMMDTVLTPAAKA